MLKKYTGTIVFCTGLEQQTKHGPGLGYCDELVSIQGHNSNCQWSLDILQRLSQVKWGQVLLREHLVPLDAIMLIQNMGRCPWLVTMHGNLGCFWYAHRKSRLQRHEHMWIGANLYVQLDYVSFCPALTSKQLDVHYSQPQIHTKSKVPLQKSPISIFWKLYS